MKTTFTTTCTVLLLSLCFQSCVKWFCQCEPIAIDNFECRIVSPQGRNLVLGAQAIFKLDSLKVLKNRNDLSVQNAEVSSSYGDTANLQFHFRRPETKSYIYYNQQTGSDSLEIEWVDKQGKCCGDAYTYSSIRQVKFNGAVVQPQGKVYYLIKQ